jgi:hypothetical protein
MQSVILLTLLFLAAATPGPAGMTPVRVAVPIGIATSDISTTNAKDPLREYVTIEGIRVLNPSHHAAQGYDPKDFHLLVGDHVYLPSARPDAGSLDLKTPGVLAPGRAALVTVSFLVPAGIASAKFEFMPHWMDDAGETVDWCCYYL